MEDVVLHLRPGSAAGLSSLLEQTEKLLEPFACRPPPAFSPWFPTRRPPIRPAKPAPRIVAATTEDGSRAGETPPDGPEDELCVSETPDHLLPVRPAPGGERSPARRSWSVSPRRTVPLRIPPSRRLRRLVSAHGLHPRQRAKWVITAQNCGDLEKAWRRLSRSVGGCELPTCNVNIQRERAEIWVFCDVLYSEEVGRFLKRELRLAGRIRLDVHKLGKLFSM